jgi:hypothetical protein
MVAGDGRTEKLLRPDGVDDREVPEMQPIVRNKPPRSITHRVGFSWEIWIIDYLSQPWQVRGRLGTSECMLERLPER